MCQHWSMLESYGPDQVYSRKSAYFRYGGIQVTMGMPVNVAMSQFNFLQQWSMMEMYGLDQTYSRQFAYFDMVHHKTKPIAIQQQFCIPVKCSCILKYQGSIHTGQICCNVFTLVDARKLWTGLGLGIQQTVKCKVLILDMVAYK